MKGKPYYDLIFDDIRRERICMPAYMLQRRGSSVINLTNGTPYHD